MTSYSGYLRSDHRRAPPSALSPLAPPFTAGGRPHLHSSSSSFQPDGFRFPADDVARDDLPTYYGSYGGAWGSEGEGSGSWMDPSVIYNVNSVDKGTTRPPTTFPSYSEAPTNPSTSRSDPFDPFRFVPAPSDPFDPFSKGFHASVVGPMLTDVLSESFSATSSLYGKSKPDPFDPARFDYFGYRQNDGQKESVTVPVRESGRVRVSITAPVSKVGSETGTGTGKLKVKCAGTGLDELLSGVGTSVTGTGTDKIVMDQHSDDVDSPCWKGMPAQQPFSEGQNGNLPTAPLENENPSFVDKNLKSVVAEPAEEKPKEEKRVSDFELEAYSLEKRESVSCEKDEILGPKMDVKLLIKSMHDLSQVLLSSCGDGFELEEFEIELLNGAIQNLKTYTGGNKKDEINIWKIYDNIKAGGASQQAVNERNNHNNSACQLNDNDFKKSILEAVEKLPRRDSDDQAELYKNLWLEAEVSLCAMKYELQLAKKTKSKSESPKKEVDSRSSLGELKPSDPPIKPDQSLFKDQPKQTLEFESLVFQFSNSNPTEKNESPLLTKPKNSTDEEKNEPYYSWTEFKIACQEGQFGNLNCSFGPVGMEGQNGNFSSPFGPVGSEGQAGNFNPSFGPVRPEGQNGNLNSSFGPIGSEGQNDNFNPPFRPTGQEGQNGNFNPSFGPIGIDGQNGNLKPSFGQSETVDNTVMARLRILQRRDENNLNNLSGESSFFPDYYSVGYNNNNNNNRGALNFSSEWEHVAKDEL